MKNAFDLLIEGLVRDYSMSSLPNKQHEDEVYCFQFESGISIKVYQDKFRWIYFVAELGALKKVTSEILIDLLSLNGFSFRKPFFTLGLGKDGVGVLHARVPLIEVNNVEMRRVFEDLLSVGSNIKKTYSFVQ
ncbi:CesT family type III secretion system chaperone [Pseudomonas cucumis]|uniref:CesT family type III secretion system chaperone n=1 Tax=Pseudomonas cucumis TaxID=2954082 RepID=A0ABY9EQA4_9PSED|nr:CesT family type III secretion system chaperone [Pseudomonas cucumis]WLG82448.1 CesT family type III secretion system chaperone [Pseudomonas cucumis]WLG88017.1 CesT family type III secretion system chaperone [Pseudomonas cucumis]